MEETHRSRLLDRKPLRVARPGGMPYSYYPKLCSHGFHTWRCRSWWRAAGIFHDCFFPPKQQDYLGFQGWNSGRANARHHGDAPLERLSAEAETKTAHSQAIKSAWQGEVRQPAAGMAGSQPRRSMRLASSCCAKMAHRLHCFLRPVRHAYLNYRPVCRLVSEHGAVSVS